MKEEIEANKINILIVFIYAVVLTIFNLYHCYQHENRLNEQKRLLIAQQKQIFKDCRKILAL